MSCGAPVAAPAASKYQAFAPSPPSSPFTGADSGRTKTKRKTFGLQLGEKRNFLKDFLEHGYDYLEDCLQRRDPIDFSQRDQLLQTILHYLGKCEEKDAMAAASVVNKMAKRLRQPARNPGDVPHLGWLQRNQLDEDFILLAIHRPVLWDAVKGNIPIAAKVQRLLRRYAGDEEEVSKLMGVHLRLLHRMQNITLVEDEQPPEGCGCTPLEKAMLDEALRIALTPLAEKRRGLLELYEGVRESLKVYARVAARPGLVARTVPDLLSLVRLLKQGKVDEIPADLIERWYWRARRHGVATLTETHLQFRNEVHPEDRMKYVVQSMLLDRLQIARQTELLIGFSITGSSIPERDYTSGVVLAGMEPNTPAGDYAYFSPQLLREMIMADENATAAAAEDEDRAALIEAAVAGNRPLWFRLTPKGHPTHIEIYEANNGLVGPLATSPLNVLDRHPRANPKHNNEFNTLEDDKEEPNAQNILLLFSSKYNTLERNKPVLPFPVYRLRTTGPPGGAEAAIDRPRHLRAHLQLDRTERRTPDLTVLETLREIGPAAVDLMRFVAGVLSLEFPLRSKAWALEASRPATPVGSDDEMELASGPDSDEDADRDAVEAAEAVSAAGVTANGNDPRVGSIRVRLYGGRATEARNVFIGASPPAGEDKASGPAATAAAAAATAEGGYPYYLSRTRNKIYVIDLIRVNFSYAIHMPPASPDHLCGVIGYIDLLKERQRRLIYRDRTAGHCEEDTYFYRTTMNENGKDNSPTTTTNNNNNASTSGSSAAEMSESRKPGDSTRVTVQRGDPRVTLFFPSA